jgi:CubicO group peptidase (beta-lactamase class C family)
MGEVVRRITGRSIGTFFASEVAGPLNADFHIGLPAEHDHRLAPVIPPPNEMKPPPPNEMFDTTPNPHIHAEDGNSVAFRRAELPSGVGFGNARSVATVQSALTNGSLLSPAGRERALEVQYSGMDYHLGASMSYGMGYAVSGRTCFWGGMGGSLVFVDFDAAMTVAYVMNQMLYDGPTSDERGMTMVLAAYTGLAG